LKLYWI